MAAITMDHLSKGRFVLGLGSQIKPHITKRFSMEWSKPAARMRELVLARAVPASVGNSPIGGMLHPCSARDDFGVLVECVGHGEGGRPLLSPISPGLFKPVHVKGSRTLALGEPVEVARPGVLAFDGDREYTLAPGQSVRLRIERAGPRVIRTGRVFSEAARLGLFLDRPAWRDPHAGG